LPMKLCVSYNELVPPNFPVQINRNPSLTRGETCLEKLKDIG